MNRVKGISSGRKKVHRPDAKRSSKKPKPRRILRKELVNRRPAKATGKSGSSPHVLSPLHGGVPTFPTRDKQIFSFQVDFINGETTIGDLIVAFPRTRDVLMKHGLRFDVEDAGYLYMTLNVFSAINGLASHNLIEELHATAKEPPPAPVQSIRSIATVPTS